MHTPGLPAATAVALFPDPAPSFILSIFVPGIFARPDPNLKQNKKLPMSDPKL
jgi:hypothetical protein